jgi:hypothetical protein
MDRIRWADYNINLRADDQNLLQIPGWLSIQMCQYLFQQVGVDILVTVGIA